MSKKKGSKIFVVKLGTRVLTFGQTNELNESRIKNIAAQVSQLIEKGYKVVIVSSGAIGAGMAALRLKTRPQSLPKLQACAAVGQSELMKIYSRLFKDKNHVVAQVLLTQDDLSSRERYLNAKNTIFTLLDSGVTPIINENDTVSTDEIRFGDNDRLSSLVANLIEADKLIILTDVDNLYKYGANNKKVAIYEVKAITKEIESLAGKAQDRISTGGMITKIQAAKITTGSGIACHIANGEADDILLDIEKGKRVGTIFEPCESCLTAKKKWIAFSSKKKGSLIVDKGARDALVERKKSLLSSGIVRVEGNFHIGDTVGICDEHKHEFARGLANYSAKEVDKIKKVKTDRIEKILGYKYYDEVIHKDNLVIL